MKNARTEKAKRKSVPSASSEDARRRMVSVRQRDTAPEIRLRSILHSMGFRYRIDAQPLRELRRKADIVFRRSKVAVYIDGCFWHACPMHATWPKLNARFWRTKIEENRRRDKDTNRRLLEAGWTVVRVWEHEDPATAALRIAPLLRSYAARKVE